MATKWLSKVLSASQRLRCFHGLLEDIGDLDALLRRLAQLSMDENSFTGIVHYSARHGMTAYEKVYNAGGAFCILLRNPIEVASSQFIDKSTDPAVWPRILRWRASLPPSLHWIEERHWLFARTVQSALVHYFEGACQSDALVFKFEDYTTNYAEMVRLVATLTHGQVSDDPDIARAFHEVGNINPHHGQKVTWEDIFFPSLGRR